MASHSRGRLLLVLAPLSAVVVVVLGVVAGGGRPMRSARVYGGPTQGVSSLGLRVELGERDRVAEVPLPLTTFEIVAVSGGQKVARARGKTDPQGMAEVSLELPKAFDSAFELWVEGGATVEAPLARGLVLGTAAAFARATRRGGFQAGRRTGDIELGVAPARGVLVTAQGALDDELVLRASRAGAALRAVSVDVKLEGGEPGSARVQTDELGLARLRVRPRDALLRVELHAAAEGVGEGSLAARFDVVQGAIRATRRGSHVLFESSGAANVAYAAFVDERRRYLGLHAELAPTPDGRLVAELPWPARVPDRCWIVVSSQPDLASPSAVGWPVGATEPDPKTFDVRELLLLDGAGAARAREEKRVRRTRVITAVYALAALVVTLVVFLQRVRRSERAIGEHLRQAGIDDAVESIAPRRSARTALAAACIGLGFLVVVVWAVLKD